MIRGTSILKQATETWKYSTDDKIHCVTMSDTLDSIFAMGETTQGRGILHRISKNNEGLWRQEFAQPLSALGIASAGGFVAVGSDDLQVYYFDKHGMLLWKYPGRSKINSINVSYDGRFAIAGFQDGNIMFFDNTVSARKFVWKHKFDTMINETDISANGDILVACTEEGEVALFTDKGINTWTKAIGCPAHAICISRSGDNVVAGGADGRIYYYLASTGQTMWNFLADGPVMDLALTGRGERIVAVTKAGSVMCVDNNGRLIWKYSMGSPGERIDMARNGKCIVVSTVGTALHCLDMMGCPIWSFDMTAHVEDVKISPTGDHIVATSQSGVFFFDNLQVIGGLVPRSQQAISNARSTGKDVAQAQRHYDEAVAALSNGDYLRAMQSMREMEVEIGIMQQPQAQPAASQIPPPPVMTLAAQQMPPGPPQGVTPDVETKMRLEDEIGQLLEQCEGLKDRGHDIAKVENLLGDAALLNEDGKSDQAEAHIANAKFILNQLAASPPAHPSPTTAPAQPAKEKAARERAPERILHGTRLLAVLKGSEANVAEAEKNLELAKQALEDEDDPKALLFAEKSISGLEAALDGLISDILKSVQSQLKEAERGGIDTRDVKEMLLATSNFMKQKRYDSALESAQECEEWLGARLESMQPKPAPVPKPAPAAAKTPKASMPPVPAAPPAPSTPPTPELEELRSKFDDMRGRMEDLSTAIGDGNVEAAVDVYMSIMEGAETSMRDLFVGIIGTAKDEMVRHPEMPNEEVERYIVEAKGKFEAKEYVAAIGLALKAKAEAFDMDKVNAHKSLKEVKERLELATAIGAEISRARTAVADAEKALANRQFAQVQEHTSTALAELENAQVSMIETRLASAKEILDAAEKIGADVKGERRVVEEASGALAARSYQKAFDMAKKVEEMAARVPIEHVNRVLAGARTRVMEAEAMGANTMTAKNHMIRAKSFLAQKDFVNAFDMAKKCDEEAVKAPLMLITQTAASLRSEIAAAQGLGIDTTEAEKSLEEAKAQASGKQFKPAIEQLRAAKDILAKKMTEGTAVQDVVNAIYEVDTAIMTARDQGKDVARAQSLLDQAMAAQETDPKQALVLAKEAMGAIGSGGIPPPPRI